MKFRREVVKDLISENSGVAIEAIDITDVYEVPEIPGHMDRHIVAEYCVTTIKAIDGIDKEFTYCKTLAISKNAYSARAKSEERAAAIERLGL